MSHKRKITIVLLGTANCLKKSLVSLILGKDVFEHRSSDVKTEKYENDTYEVTFTPDLYKASEEIKDLFSSERPDMCLLVVEKGFSTEHVWHDIEKLAKITGKKTEEIVVVLPLGCKHEEYLFKFYTMEELFIKLGKLAEDKNAVQTKKGSTDQVHTQMNMSVNLVLLGMSGTGKSVSGNTILGKTKFVSKASSEPVTRECQAAETEINGTFVRVIDTPDIFDDDMTSSVKNHHVTQCRQLCQSDPCVYLLVIEVSRFTDGERNILKKFEAAFGPRAKDQTIILFTRGEDLQRAGMSLEKFLKDCQPELKNIVQQCGGRCVLFENKTSRQPKVIKLMQTVNMLLKK